MLYSVSETKIIFQQRVTRISKCRITNYYEISTRARKKKKKNRFGMDQGCR